MKTTSAVAVIVVLAVILSAAWLILGPKMGTPEKDHSSVAAHAKPTTPPEEDSSSLSKEKVAEPRGGDVNASRDVAASTRKPSESTSALIVGTVRDQSGELFVDSRHEVRISLLPTAVDDSAFGKWIARCKDGIFGLHGVPPGVWRLQVRHDRMRTLDGLVEIPAFERVGMDIILDPRTSVHVRLITPEGADLVDNLSTSKDLANLPRFMCVFVCKEFPPALLPEPHTPASRGVGVGFAAVPDRSLRGEVAKGPIELLSECVPPFWVGLAYRHVVIAQEQCTDPLAVVTLEATAEELLAQNGRVSLRAVHDETGEPIQGLGAQLSGLDASWVETGSDGSLCFDNVIPGVYALNLVTTPPSQWTERIRVSPEEDLDLGELRVGRTCSVRLRLLDSQDRIILQPFELLRLDRFQTLAPIRSFSFLVASADGVFPLQLGRGLYALSVHDTSLAANPKIIDTRSGESLELDLHLHPGTRVVFHALEDGLVQVRDASRAVVFAEDVENGFGTELRLVPGSYSWQLFESRQPIAEASFDVGTKTVSIVVGSEVSKEEGVRLARLSEESVKITILADDSQTTVHDETQEVSLSKGVLHGTVTDDSGDTVSDVEVTAQCSIGGQRSVRADHEGRYAIPDVAPATWGLSVEASDHLPYECSLEVHNKLGSILHDIRLTRAPKFTVRVLAPDGRPLSQLVRNARLDLSGSQPQAFHVVVREQPWTREESDKPSLARADDWFETPKFTCLKPLPLYVTLLHGSSVLGDTRLVEHGQDVVFVVDPESMRSRLCTIRCKVVDASTGELLFKPKVNTTNESASLETRITTPTDSDGWVTLSQQQIGRRKLQVEHDGYQRVIRILDLEEGETRELGVVELMPLVQVSGKVLDEKGLPLSANLSGRDLDRIGGDPEPSRSSTIAHTDHRTGDFEGSLGRGRWLLEARSERLATLYHEIDLSQGPVRDLVLTLTPGQLLIVHASAAFQEERRVHLVHPCGEVIARRLLTLEKDVELRVSPGRWTIELLVEDKIHESRDVEITDSPVTIEW